LARANLGSVRFTERLLAGAIGAASARVVVAGSLQRKMLSRVDVMAVLDDASQAIRFNHELLRATLENVSQGICVFDSALCLASWTQQFLTLNDLTAETVRVGTSLAELANLRQRREATPVSTTRCRPCWSAGGQRGAPASPMSMSAAVPMAACLRSRPTRCRMAASSRPSRT